MKQVVNIFINKSIFGAARFALLLNLFLTISVLAQNMDIPGPPGSGFFGARVYALPNGNIVVTDPSYDIPSGASNVGAVHLYNGTTGALINTMIGSAADDEVGSLGVTVLTNGNYVVNSLNWNNEGLADVGAVTFCNGATGCPQTISPANSLVGSSSFDSVGIVTVLPNGNYIVTAPNWDNIVVQDTGAATLCSGTTGCTGTISEANSLVGTNAFDAVGNGGIVILTNGSYLVRSYNWNNGAATKAGAVTFCNAATGTVGPLAAANSLVGSTANDQIGTGTEFLVDIQTLTNGNYVVLSPNWDSGTFVNAGAATFGSGTTGVSGVITPSNSLIGMDGDDKIGNFGATALTNGNYVVCSPYWGPPHPDTGVSNHGAATFGNGTTGVTGTVSAANSLVGDFAYQYVCYGGVKALPNGNYVVLSPRWEIDYGAVTFGNGTTGTTGIVSPANSLAGANEFDFVGGGGITVLANGNFVVNSPDHWGSGGFYNGAVTWCSGTTGCPIGAISTTNSILGVSFQDRIGNGGVVALPNGNYVIVSPDYDNVMVQDVGAVTLVDGSGPTAGQVTVSNSMVGWTANDRIGSGGVKVLSNGNYVAASPSWDNNGLTDAGAVTFRGATDFGNLIVSPANSLVGSWHNDFVGGDVFNDGGVFPLPNGNYVVASPSWSHGMALDAGAVTFGNGTTGIAGPISIFNSLVGGSNQDFVGKVTVLPNNDYIVLTKKWDFVTIPDAGAVTRGSGTNGTVGAVGFNNSVTGNRTQGGIFMNFVFDAANNQVVVGRPLDNIVTLSRPFAPTAATISISGNVTNGKTGVPRASVMLTDSQGSVRTAKTSSFGYFKFEGIQADRTLIIQVAAKGLIFTPQVITPMEDITDLIFTAQ